MCWRQIHNYCDDDFAYHFGGVEKLRIGDSLLLMKMEAEYWYVMMLEE
jgi:hypothetical protein